MPTDAVYEERFESLLQPSPSPPKSQRRARQRRRHNQERRAYGGTALVPKHGATSTPEKYGDADADLPAAERGSPAEEYGVVSEGQAVFEPDEYFLAACRAKGVLDPETEFAGQTVEDFMKTTVGSADEEVARVIAERKLAMHDKLRARKMALVLREREQILERLEAAQAATQQDAAAADPTVAAALAGMKSRAYFRRTRAAYADRARRVQSLRAAEERRRQEAAYNEVKVRTLVSAVQKRELEKMNEAVLAERHKRFERARTVRETMKTAWHEAAKERSVSLERRYSETAGKADEVIGRLGEQLRARACIRDQRIQHAAASRQHADAQREEALSVRERHRGEVFARKHAMDAEKGRSLKYRRTLQEAYTKQVLSTSGKLRELHASEVRIVPPSCSFFLPIVCYRAHTHLCNYTPCRTQKMEKYREKDGKSSVMRLAGSQDATWRVDALAATNELRRAKVAKHRALLDEERTRHAAEGAEARSASLGVAEKTRQQQQTLRTEMLRIEQEKKREMAQRLHNELEQQQLDQAAALQAKYAQQAQRLRHLNYLKTGTAALEPHPPRSPSQLPAHPHPPPLSSDEGATSLV